jgi:hypothetical protein
MPGERSVAIEYLSIILRAIENAQNDPAEWLKLPAALNLKSRHRVY